MANINHVNPDEIRSQELDQSQASAGVGELNESPKIITTVEADSQTDIESADVQNESVETIEWSSEKYEVLTEQIRVVEIELPETLREITGLFTETHEKMLILYGLVSSMGCVSPMSHVVYGGRKNYPCLMTLLLMPPASGKGVINLLHRLYAGIDSDLKAQYKFQLSRYQVQMQGYKKALKKGEVVALPQRPPVQLLCAPGNTTSSMLVQLLADAREGSSLLQIETEADVLSTSGNSEHFRLNSTLYRQIYHHESVSLSRRGEAEVLTCNLPKLNMILTGTEGQSVKLLRSASDGLVSRFLVLYANPPLRWKDVSTEGPALDDQFDLLAEKVLNAWKDLREREIKVQFSKDQWSEINRFGQENLSQCFEFCGPDAASIPKRHANMWARICLVLTIVRNWEEKNPENVVVCSDKDFRTARWIMNRSYESAIRLYKTLPGSQSNVDEGSAKFMFFNALPESFRFQDLKAIIESLRISDRTANRYLASLTDAGLLSKIRKGVYRK